MSKTVYSDEQKAAVLARVAETSLREAAAEAGIPWQTVARWRKQAEAPAQEQENGEEKKASASKRAGRGRKKKDETVAAKTGRGRKKKEESATAAKKGRGRKKQTEAKAAAAEAPVKAGGRKKKAELPKGVSADASPLEIENAVLRSENAALKAEVEKWKTVVKGLM